MCVVRLILRHRPLIFILVESRPPSSRTTHVLNNSHIDLIDISEANGFLGGIWNFGDAH